MKKQLIIIIAVLLLMIELSGCVSNSNRDIYDEGMVESFIMLVLDDSENIWDYYGVKAKKTGETENADIYSVYGNIQMESISYLSDTSSLVWKTFHVTVYVFDADIVTEDWEFN